MYSYPDVTLALDITAFIVSISPPTLFYFSSVLAILVILCKFKKISLLISIKTRFFKKLRLLEEFRGYNKLRKATEISQITPAPIML